MVDERQEHRVITGYELLKFFHILFAIVAVGFNISYSVWLARAARDPTEQRLYVLRGIKVLDDRFANPSYGLLLITGIWMVAISPLELTTFWILVSLILYVLVIATGLTLYTPALRAQGRALETEGPESDAYRRADMRQRVVGIGLSIPVVVIVFLMVTKPTL
jgi:uncharacterized membrane protein